jgi:predicted nucleotidyltransferase component of viral defense system
MKEFIYQVSRELKTGADLVEKDFLLHTILLDLSRTKFANEYVFKGGTSLVKHYLGYHRFSVDLDFTFINQALFQKLTKKAIRKTLSEKIDDVGAIFEEIAGNKSLDFKYEKGNKRYVEFGGGNKFLTLKLWWDSPFTKETFIKIQINFLELILFPITSVELKSPLKNTKELEFLFPLPFKEYTTPISYMIYDIKELFCEKVRAILTRRGIKERYFIDCYLISKRYWFSYKELEKEILEKTKFMLGLYTKYQTNMEENLKALSVDSFPFGSESHFLLTKIDTEDYYRFVKEFIAYLKVGFEVKGTPE